MKYLIIGNHGQLGTQFEKYFSNSNIVHKGVDIDEIDVGDSEDVMKLISSLKPDCVINCSAFTLVDDAEKDTISAYRTNADGVRNLAQACEKYRSFLVHYSTDYVFDGEKTDGLYTELDPTNPINHYGKSKLQGELFLKDNLENYLLFRLSWVFGNGKNNFIYKFLQWCENNPYLKISCDETSVPTYTKTVLEVTIKALEQQLTGLYHLTNSGYASRYEWAKAIVKAKKIDKFIYPISKNIFNLPARRPTFSAMSNKKISRELNIKIPDWEEAIFEFICNDRFNTINS